MRSILLLAAAAALGLSGCTPAEPAAKKTVAETPAAKAVQPAQVKPADKPVEPKPAPAARRRGSAVAEEARPARFPHRIWAFSGFEAKPPSFGWFAKEEKQNIPKYAGNATARRAVGPYQRHAALMVGMNPVPGPRMGKVNMMYCRYYLTGTGQATFQHFSLSSGDNCNIRVSGLKQGQWAEVTLNFTRDSRRNDGSPGAFKEGERMDDLKVFVGKPNDGKTYEMVIDDVIFFAEVTGAPPEKEPFPNRVYFLAGFDTGIDPNSRPKFFPGELAIAKPAPAGSYWGVAEAVAAEGGKSSHVLVKFPPPRPLGPKTKLRFRYWVQGADKMKVMLHNATAKGDHVVQLKDLKQGEWVTRYVDFSAPQRTAKPKAGDVADELRFVVAGSGGKVRLCIDEVVLFEPGAPASK